MAQRHEPEIYANVMTSSRNYCKRTRADNSSENIYENVLIHNLESNRTQPGPALPVAGGVKRKPCRAAAVFLGLLCLLLLAGLITMVLILTKKNWRVQEVEMEMGFLQNSNSNLTREKDQIQNERRQLQTSYVNLMTDKSRVQATYDKLMEEKRQLQKKLNSMTKDRDDLQRKLQDCHQTTQTNNLMSTSSGEVPTAAVTKIAPKVSRAL